jgi:hypothetical protein
MDFAQIRRFAITAMFSDDLLFQKLVLKGGNALNLVHGLGNRTSLDVDFSIPDDFEDLELIRVRVFRALKDRFDSAGFILFDEKLNPRPPQPSPSDKDDHWGGYEIEFKLLEKTKKSMLAADLDKARTNSTTIGPDQQRVFRIQISKYEFCGPKAEARMDDYAIYVYPPSMIAIEKLRAICQQMAEYGLRGHPTPRGRDFYDIHAIVTEARVDLASPENRELARLIFDAKAVPCLLIPRINEYREFHRPDWPSVEASVSGELKDFDFYFDFVVEQAERLKSLWGE